MSDYFEVCQEHHAALNRAVLIRDMRQAQDRQEQRRAVRSLLWFGLASLVLIGVAAFFMEVSQ